MADSRGTSGLLSRGSPSSPCEWLSEDDLKLIGNLGLPDPYSWKNMRAWAQKMMNKYDGEPYDLGVIRQRFIRAKCIACRVACEGPDPARIIDPPVVLPCGHIMGWHCYSQFCQAYRVEGKSFVCPWDGPSRSEPEYWSPVCGQRIIHECDHPRIMAWMPQPYEEFALPDDFFTPVGGFITRGCRRCTVKDLLVQWTMDVRENGRRHDQDVFASCSNIQGVLEGEDANWAATAISGFSDRIAENTRTLADLFASTPTPMDDGHRVDLNSMVVYKKGARKKSAP